MIIKAIVSLAGVLSCTTIAEGVENDDQERFLKSIGCIQFQGFHYDRPLEVAQLRELGLPLPFGKRDGDFPSLTADETCPECTEHVELVAENG